MIENQQAETNVSPLDQAIESLENQKLELTSAVAEVDDGIASLKKIKARNQSSASAVTTCQPANGRQLLRAEVATLEEPPSVQSNQTNAAAVSSPVVVAERTEDNTDDPPEGVQAAQVRSGNLPIEGTPDLRESEVTTDTAEKTVQLSDLEKLGLPKSSKVRMQPLITFIANYIKERKTAVSAPDVVNKIYPEKERADWEPGLISKVSNTIFNILNDNEDSLWEIRQDSLSSSNVFWIDND